MPVEPTSQDREAGGATSGGEGQRGKDFLLPRPGVSLPRGGGALRGIDETFEANPVTGTASLSVPLGVSPGRQGHQPSLALAYDSGGGNGPFGLGWSVAVPRIWRKTDRGLPRYEDAVESDTFVISGADDLVADAGADRTDGDWLVRRYRPRVETSFARVERFTHRSTGDVWWQSRSRDNTVSIFGASAAARLADPDDPRRIAEWCLEKTENELGHVIRYEYKAEDDAGVNLRSPVERMRMRPGQRCTQLYLKRVRYGNAEPFSDRDFRFEVVFDYGEHPDDAAVESAPWAVREDPSSSFRTAFDVRTRRRCQRVLVFHAIPALADHPVLVRATALTYEATPRVSLLQQVQRSGFDEAGQPQSLPPLAFEYSRPIIDDTVRFLDDASLENLPEGLGRDHQWLDLDGEGLAGVLADQGNGWFYKRNLGAGTFGPLEPVWERPVLATAGSLQDLGGDGRLDLVVLDGPTPGLQERQSDGGWGGLRPFDTLPNRDWSDPNLRFIDLDGDGYADILITEDHVLRCYRSRAKDGFEPARTVPLPSAEDDGPALVFEDGTQSVFTADMTGDGLADLVRVRYAEVSYWPNRGHGRFGARVVMRSAPVFDAPDRFDPRRVRLVDLDGTGPTDVVYLGGSGVVLWFNEAGNGWSEARRLTGIPLPDDVCTVNVVDLFGAGTQCLVWSSPLPRDAGRPLRYVDLLAAGKPWLLTRVVNNLGAQRTLAYTPSTHAYVADRAAGRPWATRLPFPVHTLTAVTVEDQVTGARFVTQYTYHHGYFDGVEREFRGFGRVEQIDTGSVSDFEGATNGALVHHLPPVRTVTWYHTGAWLEYATLLTHYRREYWSGDPQAWSLPDSPVPVGLSAAEQREAARALRGKTLRQEVFADDGSAEATEPYTVAETNYEVRLLQPIDGRPHAVFHVVPGETITWHYERHPSDPRVRQQLTLEVDGYGNVLRAGTVGHPRRVPAYDEQAHTWITVSESTVVNRDEVGRLHLGVPIEAHTWELTGLSTDGTAPLDAATLRGQFDAAAVIRFEDTAGGFEIQRRPIGRERTYYWNDETDAALPLGMLGMRAIVHHVAALAFTPGLITTIYGASVDETLLAEAGYELEDELWWATAGHVVPDPARFYQPIRQFDPFGNETTIEWDDDSLVTARVTDAAGNESLAEYDYRLIKPRRVTDANGNHNEVAYDALGRVTKLAIMGKDAGNEGDTLDDPTIRYEYDLFSFRDRGEPVHARVLRRETHADSTSRWQESWVYSDGCGREVMSKAIAEPGRAPIRDSAGRLVHDGSGALVFTDVEPRWVGTGRKVVDNKGNTIKQYEPFFSSTHGYEDEADVVESGVTAISRYDPLGRVIRIDRPDGAYRRVVFGPWRRDDWDENDCVLDSRWYAERAGLPFSDPRRRASDLAAAHAGTPSVSHVDAAGRTFLGIADNGADGAYERRNELDVAGNVCAVIDGRGIRIDERHYDVMGRTIRRRNADSGEAITFADVGGAPLRVWKSGGVVVRTVYDSVRRPVQVWVEEAGGSERLVGIAVYGESLGDASARAANLRERVHLQLDGAGLVAIESFDFKGNALTVRRMFAADGASMPDWSALASIGNAAALLAAAATLLAAESFAVVVAYDAFNRPTARTTPDGSTATFVFNEAGLQETVSVGVAGAPTVTVISATSYNARSQRTYVENANGTTTNAEYDPLTFRPSRVVTRRESDGALLQDLTYTYDPVGNVVEVSDAAQDTLYFRNAEVPPGYRYEYDAVYRLRSAEGREHASLAQPAGADTPIVVAIPHPNDVQAVRAYTERYEYDAAGNLLEMRHVAGSAGWTRKYDVATDSNRLLGTSLPGDPDGVYSATYSFDDRGNVVWMPHLHGVAPDYRDRIASVDLGGGGRADYQYDTAGRRIRKRVDRGGVVEERFYLDGYELYRRFGGGGATLELERRTLRISDGAQMALLIETATVEDGVPTEAAPRFRYQIANHLGSSVVEVDEAGAIIGYEEYHPYGTTAYWAAASGIEVSEKRYRYHGKERDAETGLYDYGARYYAPWLGRFLSIDTMFKAESPYVYANDNPIGFVDPSGRMPVKAGETMKSSWFWWSSTQETIDHWAHENTVPFAREINLKFSRRPGVRPDFLFELISRSNPLYLLEAKGHDTSPFTWQQLARDIDKAIPITAEVRTARAEPLVSKGQTISPDVGGAHWGDMGIANILEEEGAARATVRDALSKPWLWTSGDGDAPAGGPPSPAPAAPATPPPATPAAVADAVAPAAAAKPAPSALGVTSTRTSVSRALAALPELSPTTVSRLSTVGKGALHGGTKILGGLGLVATAYELGAAAKESWDLGSVAPIGAEAVRQVGAYAGGAAGALVGAPVGATVGGVGLAAVGAGLGLEGGPFAPVTTPIGGLVGAAGGVAAGGYLGMLGGGFAGGTAGYLGADYLADMIHPN